MKLNFKLQYYKEIPLRLLKSNYKLEKAMRFLINDTKQNVWIPKKHLTENGTLIEGENLDYVFRKAPNQLNYAGITQAIPGIKRKFIEKEE